MAKQRTTDHGSTTPEDAKAFRAAVRDVKPLTQTPEPQGLSTRKAKLPPRRRPPIVDLDEAMPLIAVPAPAGNATEDPASAIGGSDALTYQHGGVRTQIMRRLRRGLIPIEAELDLHGLSQSMAREQLAGFLAQSRAAGRRCVRVIHGKGYRSGGRGPVLKVAVDLWLRRHIDVMAFTSARAIDGGTGALYVLLRA